MGGCSNANCENAHNVENVIKYISFDGPIWVAWSIQPIIYKTVYFKFQV